jgi:hypothetical protein
MTLEFHTNLGKRVVVLAGARLGLLKEWLAEIDLAAIKAKEGAADALLLDFRAQGFTPSAREANALVSALSGLCARRIPPVAFLANPGAQFGGARMLCTLGELDGCRTAPFRDEMEAWRWLQTQLEGEVAVEARSGAQQVVGA